MIKLTVVIVNYNSGEYLKRCLKSLEQVKSEADLEIYVVDNASSDESIKLAKESFSKVNYILNSKNLGFGKANNQVLKNLKTEYVLVLNPDCEVEPGVLKRLLEYLEDNSDVGAVTPQIKLSNGKIDLTAHRGFPTPWASFLYLLGDDSLYHLTNKSFEQVHEVDSITGAFFLTRKEVLDKVGYFDEDYFMYAEDIDLCFRIKQAGYKIVYIPDVEVLHHKGISSGLKKHSQEESNADTETKRRSLNHFYETMKIFYKKHYERNYPFFVNWLIYLGINLRWFLAKRKLTV